MDIIGSVLVGLSNFFQTAGIIEGIAGLANRNPADLALEIFLRGGWIAIVLIFLWGIYFDIFLEYRSGQFFAKWKFKLLAIDIPKNNEQTPKAVENIFSALAGTFTSSNLLDKYWVGKLTESFSFEIVSIEGHTRFLLRTPAHFLDLVESVIYSQYPDAEISEVSDYVDYDSEYLDPVTNQPVPFRKLKFPNPLYNLWGTEFVLVKSYPYPIRTYPEFEHQATQTFIDPMANLLEIMSRIGPGEQLWLQLVVQPRAPGWGEEAKKVVAKVQGRDYAPPKAGFDPASIINKPADIFGGLAGSVLEQTLGINPMGSSTEKKKEEDQWKMFKISPGERGVLEKIENKLSKQAFKVKFRMIYLGKKPVFAKGRGVTGITGALQQFNTSDANAFKPGGYTKTSADYFFVNQRIATKQNRILRWFCNRTPWYGETNSESKLTLLSPEELATLWHFPVMTVKASEVGMIGSKKSAPPSRLPYKERMAPVVKSERQYPTAPSVMSPVIPTMPDVFSGAPSEKPITAPIKASEPENYEEVADISPIAPTGPILGSVPPVRSSTASQPANNQSGLNRADSRRGAPPPNLPIA